MTRTKPGRRKCQVPSHASSPVTTCEENPTAGAWLCCEPGAGSSALTDVVGREIWIRVFHGVTIQVTS